MKARVPILIMACLAGIAVADDAAVDAAYFHPAASLYIHGDTTSASNLVEKGLSVYPGDGKLKRLQELLKQQDQQNQDQQNQDQQNQDQQNQDQQNQDQQNQDQQNQDQQNQDQQNQDQQNQDQQNQDQQNQDQQNQDQQDQNQQPQSAEEMSADEARQLMDAMKQEEKNKRMLLQPVMGAPVKVDKDW